MFTFIKNSRAWLKYKKTQEKRLSDINFPFVHCGEPVEYPVLVHTSLKFADIKYFFNHLFVYKEDVEKLIK